MATIQIIEARKFPSRRLDRAGRMDTMIVYTVDNKRDQTHVAIINSDTPSDAEIQAQIRQDQQQRDTLKGKTLTV